MGVQQDKDYYLWTVLGEVTDSEEDMKKGWELSGHQFGRAARSLGGLYVRRSEVGGGAEEEGEEKSNRN
jgi:hypothetical protein